jgi:DNA-binding response OmpR family regulator
VSAPRLLIADDDPNMRALVRATLAREFPDALEIPDGRALFWELMRASLVKGAATPRELVIVADIRMPAYSGLDVLDAWRGEQDDVPIVVITSFPDEGVRARVRRLGAVLVAKPFSRAQLRGAVHDAVQRLRPRTEA